MNGALFCEIAREPIDIPAGVVSSVTVAVPRPPSRRGHCTSRIIVSSCARYTIVPVALLLFGNHGMTLGSAGSLFFRFHEDRKHWPSVCTDSSTVRHGTFDITRKLSGGMHTTRRRPEPHLKNAAAWFGSLLSESADAWINDNAPRLSASVAFYAVLSIVPFLIVIGSIAAGAFGQQAVQGQLFWELQDLVGPQGASAIQGLVVHANHKSAGITALGLLTLAFGTSAVVMELRDALNKIWHVKTAGTTTFGFRGFFKLIRERFYLIGLIVGAGILLLLSLALNAVITAVSAEFGSFLPLSPTLLHAIVFVASFLVITLLFAAIYKLVPDVRLRWNDVAVGASFTSLLFTIGKQLIGIYLGKASVGSAYGAAGSFVIVLMWVYYSTQLFFFGAEFTRAWARRVHPRKEIGVAPPPQNA